MQDRDKGRAGPGALAETLAGFSGGLAVLPAVITVGLLAFSPMGAAAPQVALMAVFVTASLGALVHAALSRSSLPVSGPSSATALTMAALVAQLILDPRMTPATAAGMTGIVALCGVALLLSGLLQIGFALLGLARLARVVPQPVLAGFMNSAALLVVGAQLPLLLGLPPGTPLRPFQLGPAEWTALLLGLGTAGVIWGMARRWPSWPAALLGMLLGTAVHALWIHGSLAPQAGAVIGPVPSAWPWPPAWQTLLWPAGLDLVQDHARSLALTALALAAIGALESSLNLRAIDQMRHSRHDARRELIALGCSNMVCGLLGGVPLAVSRTRSVAIHQAGGRSRLAALAVPVALGLIYLIGRPLLAVLPLSVLAGVMLIVAWGLADRWTGRLIGRWWAGDRSRDLTAGLGLTTLVVGTTLWQGIVAGVGVGGLLSLIAFAVRMNRSLVHDRYLASARPSRRHYQANDEERLRPLRDSVAIFELDGALFFASSDRLLDEADSLPPDCRFLVLDLRRVGAIDESGAVALHQTVTRAGARGIQVLLAGLSEDSAAARSMRSLAPDMRHWPDADRAIEAAEQRLLGHLEVDAMTEIPLAGASLLAGLDAVQAGAVIERMQSRQLTPGEVLFSEGDPGDCLYVVSQGSVSILSLADRQGRTQRYLSVSPGMTIGETAMLDGGGRTACAVADTPATVHALSRQALDELGRAHPAAAVQLHRNLALHLSQRLRSAAGAWRASTR